MATTTFPANTTLHPWERQENGQLDSHGMAEIIASLGRINLARSNRSPPDWSVVDTPQAVSNLVDIICLEVTKNGDSLSQEGSSPSLYIDIQLVDNHITSDSQPQSQARGSISLMQIYLLPQDHNEPGHIYLLDVLTLGNQAAFETPRSVDLDLERLYAGSPSCGAQAHNKVTLRTILESEAIPKVFFDVRADAETLSHQYGISLAGVHDLQLMEFAARSICPLGSGLATSSSSASASASPAGGRSPIRRSSRSRSGSVTPPMQHQHYPLSPPATPSSHTILDSVESSPSSVCSRESFASEASTATTASIAISTTACYAPKASSAFEPATPPPRTRRRSLRNLNNLPRCITRDLNLPLLEQLAFSKWQAVQRKREQVSIANRELERLNRMMTPSSSSGRTAQSAAVSHSGLPLSRQHRAKRASKESSERYQLLSVEKEMDICARPLRREDESVRNLLGLAVLNVRYLPALWGEYDRRMRAGSVSGGAVEEERERIWRKRVEEGVRERLELAKAGAGEGYTSLSEGGDVSLKGRGKLVMLPPSGWD